MGKSDIFSLSNSGRAIIAIDRKGDNSHNLKVMDNLVNYLSFVALILVVILLIWSLLLTHREKTRKMTMRGRLANLRKKIDSLPDDSEEAKAKKEVLYRELNLEYLENILGGIERLQTVKPEKPKTKLKPKAKSKPKKKK